METSPEEVLHILSSSWGSRTGLSKENENAARSFIGTLSSVLFQDSPFLYQSPTFADNGNNNEDLMKFLSRGCLIPQATMSTIWKQYLSEHFVGIQTTKDVTPDLLLNIRRKFFHYRAQCWLVLHEVVRIGGNMENNHGFASIARQHLTRALVEQCLSHLRAITYWKVPNLALYQWSSFSSYTNYLHATYTDCLHLLYTDLLHCLHSLLLLAQQPIPLLSSPSYQDLLDIFEALWYIPKSNHGNDAVEQSVDLPFSSVPILLQHCGPYQRAAEIFIEESHIQVNQHVLWYFTKTIDISTLYSSREPVQIDKDWLTTLLNALTRGLCNNATNFAPSMAITVCIPLLQAMHFILVHYCLLAFENDSRVMDLKRVREEIVSTSSSWVEYLVEHILAPEYKYASHIMDLSCQSMLSMEVVSVLIELIAMRNGGQSLGALGEMSHILYILLERDHTLIEVVLQEQHPVRRLMEVLLVSSMHLPLPLLRIFTSMASSPEGRLTVNHLLSQDYPLVLYLPYNDLRVVGQEETDPFDRIIQSQSGGKLNGLRVTYIGNTANPSLHTPGRYYAPYDGRTLDRTAIVARTMPVFREEGWVITEDPTRSRVLVKFDRKVSWWQILIEKYIWKVLDDRGIQGQNDLQGTTADVSRYLQLTLPFPSLDAEDVDLFQDSVRMIYFCLGKLMEDEESRAVTLFTLNKIHDDLALYRLCSLARFPHYLYEALSLKNITTRHFLHHPLLVDQCIEECIPSTSASRPFHRQAIILGRDFIDDEDHAMSRSEFVGALQRAYRHLLNLRYGDMTLLESLVEVFAEVLVGDIMVFVSREHLGWSEKISHLMTVWTQLQSIDLDWTLRLYATITQLVAQHRSFLAFHQVLPSASSNPSLFANSTTAYPVFQLLHILGEKAAKLDHETFLTLPLWKTVGDLPPLYHGKRLRYSLPKNSFAVNANHLAIGFLNVWEKNFNQLSSWYHRLLPYLSDRGTISLATIQSVYDHIAQGYSRAASRSSSNVLASPMLSPAISLSSAPRGAGAATMGGSGGVGGSSVGGSVGGVSGDFQALLPLAEAWEKFFEKTPLTPSALSYSLHLIFEDLCFYLNDVLFILRHPSEATTGLDYLTTTLQLVDQLIAATSRDDSSLPSSVQQGLDNGAMVMVEVALEVAVWWAVTQQVLSPSDADGRDHSAQQQNSFKQMFEKQKNTLNTGMGSLLSKQNRASTSLFDGMVFLQYLPLASWEISRLLLAMQTSIKIIDRLITLHGPAQGIALRNAFNQQASSLPFLNRYFGILEAHRVAQQTGLSQDRWNNPSASIDLRSHFLTLWSSLCLSTNAVHIHERRETQKALLQLVSHILERVYGDNAAVMEAITLPQVSFLYAVFAKITALDERDEEVAEAAMILLSRIAAQAPELLSILSSCVPSDNNQLNADKLPPSSLSASSTNPKDKIAPEVYGMQAGDYSQNAIVSFLSTYLRAPHDLDQIYRDHPSRMVAFMQLVQALFDHGKQFSLLARLALHLAKESSFWDIVMHPLISAPLQDDVEMDSMDDDLSLEMDLPSGLEELLRTEQWTIAHAMANRPAGESGSLDFWVLGEGGSYFPKSSDPLPGQRSMIHRLALTLCARERFGLFFAWDAKGLAETIRARCDSRYRRCMEGRRYTGWMRRYLHLSSSTSTAFTSSALAMERKVRSGSDGGGALVPVLANLSVDSEKDDAWQHRLRIHGYALSALRCPLQAEALFDDVVMRGHLRSHLVASLCRATQPVLGTSSPATSAASSAPLSQFLASSFRLLHHLVHTNIKAATVNRRLHLAHAFKQFLEVFVMPIDLYVPISAAADRTGSETSTIPTAGNMSPAHHGGGGGGGDAASSGSSSFVGDMRSYEAVTDLLTRHQLLNSTNPSSTIPSRAPRFPIVQTLTTASMMGLLSSMLHHQLIEIDYKDADPRRSVCHFRGNSSHHHHHHHHQPAGRLSRETMEDWVEQCIRLYKRVCADTSDVQGYLHLLSHFPPPEAPTSSLSTPTTWAGQRDPCNMETFQKLLQRLVYRSSGASVADGDAPDVHFSLQWLLSSDALRVLQFLDAEATRRGPLREYQQAFHAILAVKTRVLVLLNILLLLNAIAASTTSSAQHSSSSSSSSNQNMQSIQTHHRDFFVMIYDLFGSLHAGDLALSNAKSGNGDLHMLTTISLQVMQQCLPTVQFPTGNSNASLREMEGTLWRNALHGEKRIFRALIDIFDNLTMRFHLSIEDWRQVLDYSMTTNALEVLAKNGQIVDVINAAAAAADLPARSVLHGSYIDRLLGLLDLLARLLEPQLVDANRSGEVAQDVARLWRLLAANPLVTSLNAYISHDLLPVMGSEVLPEGQQATKRLLFALLHGYDASTLVVQPLGRFLQKSFFLASRLVRRIAPSTSAIEGVTGFLTAYTPYLLVLMTPWMMPRSGAQPLTYQFLALAQEVVCCFRSMDRWLSMGQGSSGGGGSIALLPNLFAWMRLSAAYLLAQLIDGHLPAGSGQGNIMNALWMVAAEEKVFATHSPTPTTSTTATTTASTAAVAPAVRFGPDEVFEIPRSAGDEHLPTPLPDTPRRPPILRSSETSLVAMGGNTRTATSPQDHCMLRAEQAWFSIVHELVAFCVDRHPAHSEPLIAGAMVYYYSPTARAVRWCRLLEPLPTKPNRWKVFSFADRSMVEVDGQAILYADRPRVAIRVHRTPLTSSPSSSTSTTILTPAMMPYGVNGEEMMPSTTSQAMARVVAMATSSEAFAREDWAQAMAAVVVGSAIADLSTAHLSSLVLHLLSTNTAVSYLAMGLSTAPDLAICAAQATRCFLNSWEIATRNATMALAAVDDAALRLFRRQVEDVAVAVYDSRERLERALGTNNTRGESAAGGLAAFYETRSWETFRDFTIQQAKEIHYRLFREEPEEAPMEIVQRTKRGGLRQPVDWLAVSQVQRSHQDE